MAEQPPSPRTSNPETTAGLQPSPAFQSGSASSSSGGSASSWERGEPGSAPTSDSESSQHWKATGLAAADPTSRAYYPASAMSEEQLDAHLWSPPTSAASLPTSIQKPQTSSPQSAISGSPPERSSISEHATAKLVAQQQQAALNGINPHLSVAAEPFSPTQAQTVKTAAYARLLNPTRNEHQTGNSEKRQSHEVATEAPQTASLAAESSEYDQFSSNGHSNTNHTSHRDLQPSLSSAGTEEISTIFVVGFPDDLQEREFQNMFIFSPGFEAATLKIPPNANREREQSQAGRGSAVPNYSYEQDEENGGQGAGRKQIIGFAKFRTRAEAIDARNVLSGRKVDAEKGSVLKAEMAKKNLHTKRGLANDAVSGVGNPTGNASLQSLPALLAGMLQNQQLPAGVLDTAVTSLLRQEHAERDARSQLQSAAAYDAFHSMPAQAGGSYAYSSASTSPQSASAARMQQSPHAPPPHHLTARQEYAALRGEGNPRMDPARGRSPPRGAVAAEDIHTPPFAKSLMQQLDVDGDDAMAARNSTSAGYQLDSQGRRSAAYADLPPSAYYSPPSEDSMSGVLLRDRMNSLNLATQTPGLPTGIMSPLTMSPTFPRTQNPADQNPPINTLYVGGLPAVQPSLVGPLSAAHLEECLRNAFQRCPGFRRLCFRQKSNGPMCFVEFDDVHYASRALTDMYGNTLSGLVKGGIRLSFSKNPLGVRNGSMSSSSGPLSPSSSTSYLPSSDPYMSGNTSPTPSAGGHPRRPSDVSYYAVSAAAASNIAQRAMTPRSAASPTAQMATLQSASAFSPFGYSSSTVGEA